MNLDLSGKHALVLGTSKGLGRAIAQALIHEGARVAVTSRDAETARKAAVELGAAAAFELDLTVPGMGRVLVEQAAKELGGLDILVTNAGGPPPGPFEGITSDQWRTQFQALHLSVVDSVQSALPWMRLKRWGRILMIASTSAREPLDNLTISNGLRAGLLGLAKSLAREVAHDGITVNTLLPGRIDTDRIRTLYPDREKAIQGIPAARLGTPEEMGWLAAFLASDRAAYLTGQAIALDGGLTHAV